MKFKGFPSIVTLNTFLNNTPNFTQAAYVFDDYSLSQITDNNISFIVQYNKSNAADFPLGITDFDKRVIVPAMVHQMNADIMADLTNRSIDINLNTSVFPHPAIIDQVPVDAFGNNGSFLTFAAYFIILVSFFYRMVSEKEQGLRDAMRLAGQWQLQHYIS